MMEEINTNEEKKKPAGDTSSSQVPKPATGAAGSKSTTVSPSTKPKPPANGETEPKTSAVRSTAESPSRPATGTPTPKTGAGTRPAKPAIKKPSDKVTQVPEKDAGISAPRREKKTKKCAKSFKELKIQKKEIASLEKNRDRLVKELTSAIKQKKKSSKIRKLARDFSRIEKELKTRNASYLRTKKKLKRNKQ